MNPLLQLLLSLTLSGSLLMGLLLLLRPVYQGRTSLRWQYYIWLAVVLRLLLPIAPETNVMRALFETPAAFSMERSAAVSGEEISPPSLAEQGEEPQPIPETSREPSAAVPQEMEGQPGEQESSAGPGDGRDSSSRLWRLDTALVALWLGGAAVLGGRRIFFYRRFIRKLKMVSAPVTDPALLALGADTCRRMKLKGSVRLVVSGGVSTPMLLGFWRPCVVLPQTGQQDKGLVYTLLHELTHYKRRDLLYRWLAQLAVCLHWFNPLVRWMDREVSRLCELSCDEAVLELLDAGQRRAYGDTLLRAAALGSGLESSIPTLFLSRGGRLLRQRLRAIFHYQESSRRFGAAAMVLTIFISLSGLFLGACSLPSAQQPQTESAPSPAAPQGPSPSSREETEKGSPVPDLPLPQVTGPDEEGNFPPIAGADFETYVATGPGDSVKPDPEGIQSFLDHPLGRRWLAENYPAVADWKVLYEGKDFVLSPGMYDPYRYQRRDQWVPCYAVVLTTSQGDGFDRLLLLAQEDVVVLRGDDSYLPRLELRVSAYTGWESDWLLGDGSGLEAVFPPDSGQTPVLWMPEEGRGLLTAQEGVCLTATGLTQPPSQVFFSYPLSFYVVPPDGHEGDVLLMLGEHLNYAVGLYESGSRQITLLEPQKDAWQLFSLDGQALALMKDAGLTLCSFSPEGSLQPFARLEGEGGVLGEEEVFIFYQIATLRGQGGSHAILYYRQQQRLWRVCTFDTSGNILSDFSTGLPVVDDYLDGPAFQDGLVYFGYFREGTGVSDSLERYCIDARPDREHLLQQIG